MLRFLKLPLLLVALATSVFAAGPDDAGVKSVIQQFQQALERRDVAAIKAFVSPDSRGLGEWRSQPGMGRFSRQSLDSGVQGAGRAFRVGICEGRHQFRNGVELYQTDDRRHRERQQARQLLGLVCLRPPESRIYVEGGFAGLECKALLVRLASGIAAGVAI